MQREKKRNFKSEWYSQKTNSERCYQPDSSSNSEVKTPDVRYRDSNDHDVGDHVESTSDHEGEVPVSTFATRDTCVPVIRQWSACQKRGKDNADGPGPNNCSGDIY